MAERPQAGDMGKDVQVKRNISSTRVPGNAAVKARAKRCLRSKRADLKSITSSGDSSFSRTVLAAVIRWNIPPTE